MKQKEYKLNELPWNEQLKEVIKAYLLAELRRELLKAHKHGQLTLVFYGTELDVDYAKYLAECWEIILNNEEDSHKENN